MLRVVLSLIRPKSNASLVILVPTGPVAGSCENVNEPSNSIKAGNVLINFSR